MKLLLATAVLLALALAMGSLAGSSGGSYVSSVAGIGCCAAVTAAAASPDAVSVQSVSAASPAGNYHMKKARLGTELAGVAEIVNHDTGMRDYVVVLELRDAGGITLQLDIFKGLLGAGQAATLQSPPLAISAPGDYYLRAFAWSYPALGQKQATAMTLSPLATAQISVFNSTLFPQHKTGVYVPLYDYPLLDSPQGMWNELARAKAAHPAVPFAVTINPWSGPGIWPDPNYAAGTSMLRQAGVDYVLGYLPTMYATQPPGLSLAELKVMVDRYRSWYPDVNGLMLDEVNSGAAQLPFYTELVSYARSQGMEYIVANPGTSVDRAHITDGIFDNVMIFENKVLPTVDQLQANTHYPDYPPETFSFTARNVPSLDPGYVYDAKEYVGFMYITDDVEDSFDTNPYNRLPPYFDQLVELLDDSSKVGDDGGSSGSSAG